MDMEKEIKSETIEDAMNFTQYRNGCAPLSPNHPDHQLDNIPENPNSLDKTMQTPTSNAEMKPWFPSAKGRSIVWDHIRWQADTQRAACNYCTADFQIKGGTSALLRHLKTMHPAAINFDPENPPPVARRKPKKKTEDYTAINNDTQKYMDNLLEQFLHDENAPRTENEPQVAQAAQNPQGQSRADSEIDEVIRNLQKETAEGEPPEQDQDLRRLLGIDEEAPMIQDETQMFAEPNDQNPQNPDEEKQVSSSSNAKKRKIDETAGEVSEHVYPEQFVQKRWKLPVHVLSQHIRRPPVPGVPGLASQISLPVPSSSSSSGSLSTSKYNSEVLDLETRVLYNKSLKAATQRDEAIRDCLHMEMRKMELEMRIMERTLGEPSRVASPDEPEPDQEE